MSVWNAAIMVSKSAVLLADEQGRKVVELPGFKTTTQARSSVYRDNPI